MTSVDDALGYPATPQLLAMPIGEMAASLSVAVPDVPYQIDGAILIRLRDFAMVTGDEATVRKAERERLAAWFEVHADDLRGFTDGNLSVEFVAFLLRLAGE